MAENDTGVAASLTESHWGASVDGNGGPAVKDERLAGDTAVVTNCSDGEIRKLEAMEREGGDAQRPSGL